MYDCVQFHGGMGYMRESAIERMYRDARISVSYTHLTLPTILLV